MIIPTTTAKERMGTRQPSCEADHVRYQFFYEPQTDKPRQKTATVQTPTEA